MVDSISVKPKSEKIQHKNSFAFYNNKFLLFALIGVILAVVVAYYFMYKFSSNGSLYSIISSNLSGNSLEMNRLGTLIENKVNKTNELNVTYVGYIKIISNTTRIQPIIINLQKYYTSTRVTLADNTSINNSKSIVTIINNISSSFTCAKSYPLSNFTCTQSYYNASFLPSVFASLAGASHSNLGNPVPELLHVTSIKQSSYGNVPCVDITGYMLINITNISVSLCLSNEYYIPLISSETIKSPGVEMAVAFNETYLSQTASKSISFPPGR